MHLELHRNIMKQAQSKKIARKFPCSLTSLGPGTIVNMILGLGLCRGSYSALRIKTRQESGVVLCCVLAAPGVGITGAGPSDDSWSGFPTVSEESEMNANAEV